MPVHHDILLVEDEEAIVDLLCRVLERAHYTVRVATDGRQALTALAEQLPAVLILDITLPGVSGLTVLEQMHQQQLTVPTIIMTGDLLQHAASPYTGIVQILLKPFPIAELLSILNTRILRSLSV